MGEKIMPTKNGNGYIVSVNVNKKMLDAINKKPKGTRSAFLRRCIYNGDKHDKYVKACDTMLESRDKTIHALLELVRWEKARMRAVLSGAELLDYDSWRWSYADGDPKSRVDHFDTWKDVYAVIEELTPHIDGLSNAQLALEGMGGGNVE